jgi:hypothetical protein
VAVTAVNEKCYKGETWLKKNVIRKITWLVAYLCEMRYIQILAAVLKLLSRLRKEIAFVETSESLLTSRIS